VAWAQQRVQVIGWLGNTKLPEYVMAEFLSGLGENGYVEGKNVSIEYRLTDQYDRLPMLAADLVGRRVNVIVTQGPPMAIAAKAATTGIPIVISTGIDPVATGLVVSLDRPGGNITGFTVRTVDTIPKRVELLREMVPNAVAVGLLVNPHNTFVQTETGAVEDAARKLGIRLHVVAPTSEQGFAAAFASMKEQRIDALIVSADSFLASRFGRIAELALQHRVPMVCAYREYTIAGGLMSYGADVRFHFRQVGTYVGRVLKGEEPADLPVQQSDKVELAINLRTAKALGLTVPLSILARADEVIE